MKVTFQWLVLALFPIAAFADNGGNGSGGGNEIESGFKSRTLTVFNDLSRYVAPAKAELRFNVDEVWAAVNMPGGFSPLCAPTELADKIHAEGKMARVYPESPHTVSLDCTHNTKEDWQRLFDSGQPGDVIFFIHEALRVAGKSNENDYGLSSSYLAARRKMERLESKLLEEMLYNGNSHVCRIDVDNLRYPVAGNTTDAEMDVKFWVNMRPMASYTGVHVTTDPNGAGDPEFTKYKILGETVLAQRTGGVGESDVSRTIQTQLLPAATALEECWSDLLGAPGVGETGSKVSDQISAKQAEGGTNVAESAAPTPAVTRLQ